MGRVPFSVPKVSVPVNFRNGKLFSLNGSMAHVTVCRCWLLAGWMSPLSLTRGVYTMLCTKFGWKLAADQEQIRNRETGVRRDRQSDLIGD